MRATCILNVAVIFSSAARADDFDASLERASKKIPTVMAECDSLMNAGEFDAANKKLLSTFPEASRTSAESFMLGNILYEVDRSLSYKLHQAAAIAEPNNPQIVWEWALEQHRAGEYAGALASYQQFSKSVPGSSAPYALQADCLLRLNRVDEAAEAWQKSEKAPRGDIEQMENLVCAIHRDPPPHKRRCDLLAKSTQKHDVSAAADLIALDGNFPKDWWNIEPHEKYLTNDWAAIQKAKLLQNDVLSRAIACAAECALADGSDADAIKKVLEKHGLILDADHTVPDHGGLLSIILGVIEGSQAIDGAKLREQFGPKVLELARKGKDAELWNVALHLSSEATPDSQLKLEREAAKATGDPRFAIGIVALKMQRGDMKSNDPDLLAALKAHPEDATIQHAAYLIASKENKVTNQLLADAARAEFNHFSTFVEFATVVNRPRSGYLREYFAEIRKLPRDKKPTP